MRKKPYTARGIKRVPCLRCGAPSFHQWNICALGRQFFGACISCDIELNKLVLEFFDVTDREAILTRYAASDIHTA